MKTITNITWSNIPDNFCNEPRLKESQTVNFIYNGIELEAEVETNLYWDILVSEGDYETPADIRSNLSDIEMEIVGIFEGRDEFELTQAQECELIDYLINDLKTYY